jgi:hypothetical protein
MEEVLRATDPLQAGWVALLMLVLVALLGWINLVSPKKWRLLGGSLFAVRLGRQTMRDELDLQDRTLVVLLLMAAGSIALFLHQFTVAVLGSPTGWPHWVRWFGMVAGVMVLQVLAARVTTVLVRADTGLSEQLYTNLLLHIDLGIALLPFTAVAAWPHHLAWRTPVLWAAMVLTALFTAWRWLRAAAIGLGEGVPLRYIFIYLCTLEFLPASILGQRLLRSIALDPSTP